MPYFPLRFRSAYAYLRSALKPEVAAAYCDRLGYKALGISDPDAMNGYAPFASACRKKKIKPVFGIDIVTELGPFSLYALSEEGYRNLLFVFSLCGQGEIASSDLKGHESGVAIVYDGHNSRWRKDNFAKEEDYALKLSRFMEGYALHYIGIPYLPLEASYVEKLREFASSHSYKAIAHGLALYATEDDKLTLDILEAIAEERNLDPEAPAAKGFDHLLSKKEAEEYFTADEIACLDEILEVDSFEYSKKRGELLHFPLENETAAEALRRLSYEGLEKKNPGFGDEYKQRLDYELSVIEKMGYDDYFLIVADYVSYAKTHGISVGPGRGSAGGSLVAYAIDITEADPIRYGLLFERFLNPQRTSMPDIDVDFSDIDRDKVIAYISRKYGPEKVAHVITTSNIQAKQSLRDVGRVYGFPDRDISLIGDTIQGKARLLTLRDNYRKTPNFKKLVDSDPYFLKIVSLASKIEGFPRQAGLHAAGIIVDQNPLASSLPLKIDPEEGPVACLEKDYLEEQGFLKMDLLGLTNLSMVDLCLELYRKHGGKALRRQDLPYDDKEAIALIAKGQTAGIFQLESEGINRAIADIKPETFEELAALIALYRPGPMEQIPSFAKRKKGYEKVTYPSPVLESILKETYGIVVYQEQVMGIAVTYAGFPYSEADLFRRAISKKNASVLLSLKESFFEGARKLGHGDKEIQGVYSLLEKFASYGFNKSHAVTYAMLTGQMAYLKKAMPGEFYSAIMSAYKPKDPKFAGALKEAKARGLKLACPDINKSGMAIENFGDTLTLGLSYIGGLSGNLLIDLISEREMNGPYKDIYDLAVRSRRYGLKLVGLVKLIDAGALDCFGETRATLRGAAGGADGYAAMLTGEDGQGSLLDLGLPPPALDRREEDRLTALNEEKAVLGILCSGSLLFPYEKQLEGSGAIPLSELDNQHGEFLTRGIVSDIRAITTRKGSQMAFLRIFDDDGEADFTLFQENYLSFSRFLKNGKALLIKARPEVYQGKKSYIATQIKELSDA